ncbi:hypothetical protein ACFYPX_18160 [Micromonospora zamorensis]|uniref:hypothetical protein n=1 Tax=Micromonospora zamorensis TaxID=709883 RepID=UPI0036A1C3AC
MIRTGDRRKSLEAIRDKLAAELDDAFGRDAATIAKELTSVIREIDTLPVGGAESILDQLAKKRAARRAG